MTDKAALPRVHLWRYTEVLDVATTDLYQRCNLRFREPILFNALFKLDTPGIVVVLLRMPCLLIVGDDAGPTGLDGRTNEVTFDFRAADKTVVQAIVAGLGPEVREEKVRRPRQEVQGHLVPGHQPNIGHFLAWAARMPSMADHVILESAIDAGFACDFDCFEHVHAAMRALDFMRMVRMEGGIGSACDGDEIPPHLRHPTRQGLTGKAAMVVVHAGRKIVLDATIDSKPDPAGKRLRIHYGWSSSLQRYVVGWVSDLAPKAQ